MSSGAWRARLMQSGACWAQTTAITTRTEKIDSTLRHGTKLHTQSFYLGGKTISCRWTLHFCQLIATKLTRLQTRKLSLSFRRWCETERRTNDPSTHANRLFSLDWFSSWSRTFSCRKISISFDCQATFIIAQKLSCVINTSLLVDARKCWDSYRNSIPPDSASQRARTANIGSTCCSLSRSDDSSGWSLVDSP